MSRKPQGHDWRDAKKLCRLNQNDIAMAKRLGFRPDSLIRARPNPKQKWKLPVKYWIRELHSERFGSILGERAIVASPPAELDYDEEAVRLYGERLYWEEYWERNSDAPPRKANQAGAAGRRPLRSSGDWISDRNTDDDIPF